MKLYRLISIILIQICLTSMGGIQDISFKDAKTSKIINIHDFKDKLILFVNTASLCGFTKQYDELEMLWKKYKDKGLVIIAIPTNDFGNQEPGSNAEIANFCEVNFNIDFIITEKIASKGADKHPFFKEIRKDFGFLAGPHWNFYKYIYSSEGKPIKWYSSFTRPTSNSMIKLIEKNLPK